MLWSTCKITCNQNLPTLKWNHMNADECSAVKKKTTLYTCMLCVDTGFKLWSNEI